MTTCTLKGVPVTFPFEPYQIQKDYMEKVIECLQNDQNAVLESPTGTGKTLSLLCSSLAWLTIRKAQIQADIQAGITDEANAYMESVQEDLNKKAGGGANTGKGFFSFPCVIYASRTHSQLSQAMQELKKTAYNHLKACVIGSRDQTCIHPEVTKESSNKNQLCKNKVQTRSCHFYNRVERKKLDPAIQENTVMDIEDIVKLGKLHKFCPFYMSHELKQVADIIFMPYNYLLDPVVRKALKIPLKGNVIIFDEGHNIEKMCEESASLQIKTTDITLCIDEVTEVMKAMSEECSSFLDRDTPKDFTADELCVLKDTLLNLEKALDEIPLGNSQEGTTFDGCYIFEVFAKAGITDDTYRLVIGLSDKIVSFLSTAATNGPFSRKGDGLQLLHDLLAIAYMNVTAEFRQKIKECYKVHIAMEQQNNFKKQTNWLSKATSKNSAPCRILNYWCFNPGFGMNMLMDLGVKSVILTSGTLAPLPPLISELGIKVDIRLENPHVVSAKQICVKLICSGPDKQPLNCSYNNRDNPKFIASVGLTILNLIRMIPDGVLIFFPSYPIMRKFEEQWKAEGLWGSISQIKPIFVEPRDKEAFNAAMNDFYSRIQDPNYKGAIFMGVCRGKVSEGLDFADANGRAVLIVGLPYPPLKDPRIILKKRYLDFCNSQNKEYLRGDDWYSLEAVRAINQAMGRVIRHQNDYGAIILLDNRFNNFRIKSQLSRWLRDRIELVTNFGTVVRDLKKFFNEAECTLPKPKDKSEMVVQPEFSQLNRHAANEDQNVSESSGSSSSSSGLVTIHKRSSSNELENKFKRKKIVLVTKQENAQSEKELEDSKSAEFMLMVKDTLNVTEYKTFLNGLVEYRNNLNFNELVKSLDEIFVKNCGVRFLLSGLWSYINAQHKALYAEYYVKMR